MDICYLSIFGLTFTLDLNSLTHSWMIKAQCPRTKPFKMHSKYCFLYMWINFRWDTNLLSLNFEKIRLFNMLSIEFGLIEGF